jgi:hypothetical protein
MFPTQHLPFLDHGCIGNPYGVRPPHGGGGGFKRVARPEAEPAISWGGEERAAQFHLRSWRLTSSVSVATKRLTSAASRLTVLPCSSMSWRTWGAV